MAVPGRDLSIDERNVQYRLALRHSPEVRSQVPETLEALTGRFRLAIVTGSRRDPLHLMHQTSGILGFFDTIITADDYLDPKPSPAPYLAAVDALHLNAKECIAVEDSQRGLESAVAAGIPCVVVPNVLTRCMIFQKLWPLKTVFPAF